MPSADRALRRVWWWLGGLALLFVAVWQAPAFYTVQGLANYLPLHMFAETFSVVISMLVFGVAWNAYSAERPGNTLILACAFFAVGMIDFAHMLSFKGMPEFITPSDPEKAINLWLSARAIAALALLAAALRPWQPLANPGSRYALLGASVGVTALIVWLGVVYPHGWPRTFIPGQGLTRFKIGAEYAIIAALVIPAALFYRRARQHPQYDAASLFAAVAITILSELCFTLYSDVTDVFNLLGHAYKVVAYSFIYRAMFVASVAEPFRRLDEQLVEKRRIAEELRTASLYTRSLIEASLDPLVTISPEGKVTDVNAATEKVTGRSRFELIGTDFSDYFTEPHMARAGYLQVFSRGFVTDYPLAIRHQDGHITEVLYNATTYRNEAGEVLGVFAAARDITERKRAEAELTRLAAIVEYSNDAIIGKTREGIITTWNEAAQRTYGYSAEEIVGQPVTVLAPPARHAEIRELLEKTRRGETVMNHESERIRKDGRLIQVALTLSPIKDGSGNITGISTIARDITERKQAEEVLRRYRDHLEEEVQERTSALVLARNAAEAANRAKSIFLANMSHELRTPLNAILGFSGIMRRDPLLRADQHENLDIINRSGEHLLTLINDVLEMAKVEAGRVELENAPFDLGRMVRDVTDMMQVRAQEKGLQLLVDQSSRFPRYIRGDEARLRQILINLVGNAIKFTPQGGVTVRLGVPPDAAQLRLRIEVEDSGIGIRQEDQQKIFEPFVQLGQLDTQKGTGLGLTITRQFVQLMGGSIGVQSTPGKGSIFHIELPVEKVTAAEVMKPAAAAAGDIIGLAPGQPQFRILIAEDQMENQLLLSKLMKNAGFQVRVAENGARAVEAFQSWQPHLIWMDRRMPEMDGVEATRRIRALPGGGEVKIVAVTASAFAEQREEMLQAGMNDFVRKPYRFSEIYDCMSKHLGVKYLYAGTPEQEEAGEVTLTAQMLGVLPHELRGELRDALESLEIARINACLQKVQARDARLHQVLSHLAGNFDYPPILKALQDIGG